MEHELCFVIEGQELYLEQVLVDYNDMPIFFICKSNDKFFVVLCTNLDEVHYVIVKSKGNDISKMLHGKITMRELIENEHIFWDVSAGENLEDDIVVKKSICELDVNDLPEKGAYFKAVTPQISTYIEKFDNELMKGLYQSQGEYVIFSEELGQSILVQVGIRERLPLLEEYIQLYEKIFTTKLDRVKNDIVVYEPNCSVEGTYMESTWSFTKIDEKEKIEITDSDNSGFLNVA